MIIPTAKTISPDSSPINKNGKIVIANAAANRYLSFIICMNGEFEPTAAEFPRLAIRTIENFAKISLRRIILNNS